MTDPANQPVKGSIEILTGTEPNVTSVGLAVTAVTPEMVPMLVEAIHGIPAAKPAKPGKANRRVKGEWTATGDRQQPVRIILHEETPFDETTVAEALAAVLAEQEVPPETSATLSDAEVERVVRINAAAQEQAVRNALAEREGTP